MRAKIGAFLIAIGLIGAVIVLGKAAETSEKDVYWYSRIFIGCLIITFIGLGLATFPKKSSTK